MVNSEAILSKHWFFDGLDAANHVGGQMVAMAYLAPSWFEYAYVSYDREERGWDGGVIPNTKEACPERNRLLLIAVMGCLAEGKRNFRDRIDKFCLEKAAEEIHTCLRQRKPGVRLEIQLVDGTIRLPVVTSDDFLFIRNTSVDEINWALRQGCDYVDNAAFWGWIRDASNRLSQSQHGIFELPWWCHR